MDNRAPLVTTGKIERLIFRIRGQNVMLSTHLAELYEVEPRTLVQAVKRNIDRFPEDFMFQLTDKEFEDLKSQIVISSWGGIRRAPPYAFSEHGALMATNICLIIALLHALCALPQGTQGQIWP